MKMQNVDKMVLIDAWFIMRLKGVWMKSRRRRNCQFYALCSGCHSTRSESGRMTSGLGLWRDGSSGRWQCNDDVQEMNVDAMR